MLYRETVLVFSGIIIICDMVMYLLFIYVYVSVRTIEHYTRYLLDIFPVLIISLDRNIAELDANHTSRIRAGRLQNTCR